MEKLTHQNFSVKNLGELTDEQLVTRYLKGNEAVLEILVKKYLPLIYGFSRGYTGDAEKASDIAQETFLKAWRNLRKFDIKKNFKTWLYAIARNTAIDWLRKKEEIPFSAFDAADGSRSKLELVADSRLSPAPAAETHFTRQTLMEALGKLPARYGLVVSMRHDDDLKFKEIADILNEPLNTVKSRYRRAINLLRRNLNKDLVR